jgi:hypothetical protein
MACDVTFVQGLPPNIRRGLAFLAISDDKDVNARQVFDGLKTKARYDLLNRFQHWQDGLIQDQYHHGWRPLQTSAATFLSGELERFAIACMASFVTQGAPIPDS